MDNVSSERKTLAAAIKEREAWEKLEPHVEKGDLTEQASIIWKAIGDYYSRDSGAGSCDVEILSRRIAEALSNDKHRAAFAEILNELGELEVSPANVVYDFVAVKKDSIGSRLATELLQATDPGSVRKLMEEWQKWDETTELDDTEESTVVTGLPVEELSKSYTEEELIKVWPSALNRRLDGGLLRGHHMVVFARPEMGKTMFLVNAVAGFLQQDLKVLYIGNEDPIFDIVLRTVCRLTKLSKVEVLENPEQADTLARERGYDNLVLAGLAPGTPREIEELVEEYEPDILLIDQLRNLRMKEDNYVEQLEKAATAARNIGKRNGTVVISATQAGDSASGKTVLEMGDVDFSNTGIPSQADVMVGLGASQDDLDRNRRIVSLPKNKRSGDHTWFPIQVNPVYNRIVGVD